MKNVLSTAGVVSVSLLMLLAGASAQTKSGPDGAPFLKGLDVSINGSSPMRFGLDTGAAADFFIVPEKARQLGLPVTGHRMIHTSDRQARDSAEPADIVRATTLQVANHTFTAPEGLTSLDPSHDGTLGITLFHDVLLTLDYPHDRLSISSGALPLPNGRDVIAYTTNPDAAFRPLRVSPTVTIQLAGHAFSALLDTGARKINADVIVPAEMAATLPLGPPESQTILRSATKRQFPSYTAKLRGDLMLGEIVVHNPTVLVSDMLGFIDLARLCNRLILTIDQRNHRLRISLPSTSDSEIPTPE